MLKLAREKIRSTGLEHQVQHGRDEDGLQTTPSTRFISHVVSVVPDPYKLMSE